MAKRFRSVRFEISIIYTLILGLVLVSFTGVFYFVTSRTLYDELDNELQIKAQSITDNIRSYLEIKGEKPQTLRYAVEQTIAHEDENLRRWWYIGFDRSWSEKVQDQDLSEDFVNFISLHSSVHIKSKNLDGDLLGAFMNDTQLLQDQAKFWDLDLGENEIRVINYPFPPEGKPTHIIQVGISKGPVIHLLKEWMTRVAISIPVILILTAFVGWMLASRVLRPIDRILTTAGRISYENLNLRVEPKMHYKEMDKLIVTFNDMISRLEDSFKHIEEFSTHVAHELKTPLAIIRGEAELALMEAKSAEHKTAMKTIIGEIDTVLKTIEDLLLLSKTNYHPESFDFVEIDLAALLAEIRDQLKLLAGGKGIALTLADPDGPMIVRADRLHLRRLFLNLLDNALKFTPKNGEIRIEALTEKDKVRIRVADTGTGISRENLKRVFEQFFHEETRKKGAGLGLSIAQAIAKAHGGEITVESKPAEGTTFTVNLPLLRTLEPALL